MTEKCTHSSADTETPLQAKVQQAIMAHPYFQGSATLAYGLAGAAIKAMPDVAQSARETALEAAALDFIAKVERGEARSAKSYAAFKAALDTGLPTAEDVRGILAVPHNGSSAENGGENPLDFAWDRINALGGRAEQDNSYDQGFVDAIGKALEVIEALGGKDPLAAPQVPRPQQS